MDPKTHMAPKTTYTASHSLESNNQPGGSLLGHIWASIGATIVLGIVCCVFYPLAIWIIGHVLFPIQANGSLVKKDGTFTTDDSQAVGSYLIGQNFSAAQYFAPRPSAAGNGYDATSSGGTNLGPLSDKLINGLTTSPTPPATQPAESLTFDGIRLRTIEYAVANNIAFHLYTQRADGTGPKTEIPVSKYVDGQGNVNQIGLVDAFPHPPTDTPDRMVVFAGDFGTPIPGDAVTGSGSGLDPHISPANAKLQAGRVAAARGITADKVLPLIDQYTDKPNLGFLGDPGVNVLMLNIALDNKYPMPTPTTQPAAHS
jgi:K+-transporting ATPase ATPase C chain